MAKPKLRFPEFTDEWEEKKLKEIAVFMGGGTPSTKIEKFWNGSIPWVSSSDILEGNIFTINKTRFITREAVEQSATKLIPQNSILLVSRVGVGKLAVSYEELCTSQDFTNLIDIKGNIIYIAYTLCHKMQKELLNTQGTSIKGITSKEIKEYKIMIPSTVEQQKIADFLSFVDDIIQVQEEKICALEEQKKGIMQKLFNCEVRFKAEDGREYPEWEETTIGESGYFYYGKSAPKWSVTKDATTPCIRYGELYTTHHIMVKEIKSYTNIERSKLKFSKGGEVLVPRVGEEPLDFCKCSYLPFKDVAIGEMISVYNTKNNPLFISYFFNSTMKYEFAKRVEGGNVSNLYFVYLENIPINIPCLEEQQKIADCLLAYDEAIQIKKEKLEVWKEIKKGLLQQMLV